MRAPSAKVVDWSSVLKYGVVFGTAALTGVAVYEAAGIAVGVQSAVAVADLLHRVLIKSEPRR